ncbi:MAG TPA: hypothetical protein ACFE0H_04465, partial [Elainellaceae cyanobacterium]
LLTFGLEDLETFGELRRFRQTNEGIHLFWRRELQRLQGLRNVLLLDADLEKTIVDRYGAGEFEVIDIPARRSAEILAVKDAPFSNRATFGSTNKEVLQPKARKAVDFAETWSDALVSYKALRACVADAPKRQRVSNTESGLPIAHYGFLRGMNNFESVKCLSIIGRYDTGNTVVDTAQALFWDDPKPISDEQEDIFYKRIATDGSTAHQRTWRWQDRRVRTVKNAKDHAETRQAIDRGRWIGKAGVVLLFTNAPIPGVRIDRFVGWKDVERAWLFERMLDFYGGVVPLKAKRLVADGWFDNENQAKAWCRNECENPIRVLIGKSHSFRSYGYGRYRNANQRGRSGTPFVARTQVVLEEKLGPDLKRVEPQVVYIRALAAPEDDPHPEAPANREEAERLLHELLDGVFGENDHPLKVAK